MLSTILLTIRFYAAEHRSKLGACDVMCQNPNTGVMHLGHQNGVVTFWSPAAPAPLIRMLAHPAPLRAVAVDSSGTYMATAAANTGFKIFDLRTLRELHHYTSVRPVSDLNISQRGLLAVGFGSHIQMWKDSLRRKGKRPYMRHEIPGSTVKGVAWRPFEDVLGVGHDLGFHSIVVPGAGEANYDALEANPFESRKERRETEVHQLLDKLLPETISLKGSDFLGEVDSDKKLLLEEQRASSSGPDKKEKKEKNKQRGRSKTGAKLRKKRKNVMDLEKAALKKRREEEIEAKQVKRLKAETERRKDEAPAAIRRFFS